MDYKNFNKYLKDLWSLRNGKFKDVTLTDEEVISETDGSIQGVEGLIFEVYKLPFDELYIRLKICTDSYGENEAIVGIEFVTPKKVEVTKFLPKNK